MSILESVSRAQGQQALQRLSLLEGQPFLSNDQIEKEINAADVDGNTVLHFACYYGPIELVRALLQRKELKVDTLNSARQNPAHWAVKAAYVDALHELLEKGYFNMLLARDQDGYTPFITAAQQGAMTVMEWLYVRGGVSVEEQDDRGKTALHWAAYYGRKKALQYLIARGASISHRDHEGMTPLHWSCAKGNVDIVVALLKVGGVHLLDSVTDAEKRFTPLSLAWRKRHLEVYTICSRSKWTNLFFGRPFLLTNNYAWTVFFLLCLNFLVFFLVFLRKSIAQSVDFLLVTAHIFASDHIPPSASAVDGRRTMTSADDPRISIDDARLLLESSMMHSDTTSTSMMQLQDFNQDVLIFFALYMQVVFHWYKCLRSNPGFASHSRSFTNFDQTKYVKKHYFDPKQPIESQMMHAAFYRSQFKNTAVVANSGHSSSSTFEEKENQEKKTYYRPLIVDENTTSASAMQTAVYDHDDLDGSGCCCLSFKSGDDSSLVKKKQFDELMSLPEHDELTELEIDLHKFHFQRHMINEADKMLGRQKMEQNNVEIQEYLNSGGMDFFGKTGNSTSVSSTSKSQAASSIDEGKKQLEEASSVLKTRLEKTSKRVSYLRSFLLKQNSMLEEYYRAICRQKCRPEIGVDVFICPVCRIVQPFRGFHCKELGACIERFDHYCPWIDNAVGLGNQRLFFCFIWELFALLLLYYNLAMKYFYLTDIGVVNKQFSFLSLLGVFMLGCLNAPVLLFVSLLVLRHTLFLFLNVTTSEYLLDLKHFRRRFPQDGRMGMGFCFVLSGCGPMEMMRNAYNYWTKSQRNDTTDYHCAWDNPVDILVKDRNSPTRSFRNMAADRELKTFALE